MNADDTECRPGRNREVSPWLPEVRRLPFDTACSPANIRHMPDTNPPVLMRHIEQAIMVIRGHRVMISSDLAALYGVEPKVLIQAVKRNIERFPDDFMFQLTRDEYRILKSQFVTSSDPRSRGGSANKTIRPKIPLRKGDMATRHGS